MAIVHTIIAQIRRLWAYWMADIARRRGCLGKSASIGIGLFAVVCACSSINLAVGNVGQRIGVVPTRPNRYARADQYPSADAHTRTDGHPADRAANAHPGADTDAPPDARAR
jgi:hypothetical protein